MKELCVYKIVFILNKGEEYGVRWTALHAQYDGTARAQMTAIVRIITMTDEKLNSKESFLYIFTNYCVAIFF